MSDSLTPDQARAEFIAQDLSALLATASAEKATLRVRALQLEAEVERLRALVAEVESSPEAPEPDPS